MPASRRFAGAAVAVRDAREFVASALDDLPREAVDTATLLVSELATNAVLHGSSDFVVTVRLSERRQLVRIGVSDSGSGEPRRRSPTPADEHGRGLQLVAAMSRRWGVDYERRSTGKTVWFQLAVPEPRGVPRPHVTALYHLE